MSEQSWLRGRTVVFNPAPKLSQIPKVGIVGRILSVVKAILGVLWRAFKRTALVIGVFVLVVSIIGVWGAMNSKKSVAPSIPDKVILSFNLQGTLPEANSTTQFLSLIQGQDAPLTMEDIVDALDKAATDKRVKAIVVKASSSGYDLTQLQTLRAAVIKFKASGKKAYIYSESYGESGYGLGLYYLASAFDEIWMQPVGVIAIGGIDMEMPFFKKVMNQYGVEGQFFQRKEYKNAMEHLSSDHMGVASREMMQSLVDDLAGQLISPIKGTRKQVSKTFDDLVNLGMLTDQRALKEGLVDHIDYEDVLLDKLRDETKGARVYSVADYMALGKLAKAEKALLSQSGVTVAVIPVDGLIMSGQSGSSPYGLADSAVGADDIVASVEDAANDPSVRAIVLRVNSPGGSPSASETIYRSLVWAKTVKKKPVIVSMGSFAASGGYWISAPADRIYAMDSTLTGSIGVVGGKINLKGVWEKYNVNWESVKYGANSGMMSLNTPFSESERTQFEESLDNVYAAFIERVAKGRKLTPDQVEVIAKGRAWTGQQAVKLGLVDEIGGMDKVLDDLAKANGVPSRHDLNLVYLPMMNDPFELALMMLSERVGLTPFLQDISVALGPLALMHGQSSARLVYQDMPTAR